VPGKSTLRSLVFAGTRLHGDDILVPVLELGRGQTRMGRLSSGVILPDLLGDNRHLPVGFADF